MTPGFERVLAAAVVCVGAGTGAASIVLVRDQSGTTYVGSSPVLLATAVAALVALVAAAVAAAAAGQMVLTLVLAVLAAAWHAPDLAGWVGSPGEVRSVAAAAPLVLVPVLALATALAAGQRGRWVWLGIVALTGLCLMAAITYDAFEDSGCWRSCDHPAWSSGWPVVPAWTAFAATAVFVLATLTRRRGRSALAVAATAAGALSVTALAVVRVDPGAGYPPNVPAWLLAELGVLALGACVVLRRARAAAMTRRLAGLVSDLSAAGDTEELTAVLREATGDPGLELHWWSEELGAWVDPAGEPAQLAMPYTAVTRGDRLVAGVSHNHHLDAGSLREALGPALRLSLENAALRASRMAELAELRACRLRIVEQSDQERCRLERNLHDGAQQRVVTLALALRLAARCAGEKPRDQATLDRLGHAQHLVEQLLTSLRDIARGVHPAVLDDGGLVPALMEHTDGLRDLRVSVKGDQSGARFSRSLELTAFLAVSEALDDAQRRGAGAADVTISESSTGLRITVLDDGDPGAGAGMFTVALRERLVAFAEILDLEIISTGRHGRIDPVEGGVLCES